MAASTEGPAMRSFLNIIAPPRSIDPHEYKPTGADQVSNPSADTRLSHVKFIHPRRRPIWAPHTDLLRGDTARAVCSENVDSARRLWLFQLRCTARRNSEHCRPPSRPVGRSHECGAGR